MTGSKLYDEKELLLLIAQGDAAAFRSMYEKYWNGVYSSALYYFQSPVTAQDVVQEVFLKLWINRNKLVQVENFGAYLKILTRNLIIDMLRRKVPLNTISDAGDEKIPEKEAVPDRQLETKEIAEHIRIAISLLTPQQLQVYNLRREKELPLKEVAEQLGIAYNTAREHMSLALQSIRAYLKEHLGHQYLIGLLFIFF